MKRIILLFIALSAVVALRAQGYQGYEQTPRMSAGYKTFPAKYYGLRAGVNFAHVSAKEEAFSCDMRARLHLALAVGYGLTSSAPVYLETGFGYLAKGGKKNTDGGRLEYNLNYLEIPLVLKYIHTTDGGFGIQPFFGGYIAYGIGGRIKDYSTETTYKAFSRDRGYFDDMPYEAFSEDDDYWHGYRRFDAGLRFGMGFSYAVAYVELSYDLGLANIAHDTFRPAHNRDFMLLFGVNF